MKTIEGATTNWETYAKETKQGREQLFNYLQEIQAIIIATIEGVYGIEDVPKEFIEILALRALFRWIVWTNRVFPDNTSDATKHFLQMLAETLKIPGKNEFKTIKDSLSDIDPKDWQRVTPYMRTPRYYLKNPQFWEQVIKDSEFTNIIQLVRNLGDKAILAQNLLDWNYHEHLPPNTSVYLAKDEWDLNQLLDKLLQEAKQRFAKNKNFIIKTWEGASGTNMIMVKFENNSMRVFHHKTSKEWKAIYSREDFLHEFNIAIPSEARVKKGKWEGNEWEPDEEIPQNFIIQNVISTTQESIPSNEKRLESSINFFVHPDGTISLIATTINLTDGTTHIWNKEVVLPSQVINIFKRKILPILIRQWYRGPIGFDFAWKRKGKEWDNVEVVVFEANTRFTAPVSPAMLAYHLLQNGEFAQLPSFELNQHYKWREIKEPTSKNGWILIVPFSPPRKEQWVYTLEKVIDTTGQELSMTLSS